MHTYTHTHIYICIYIHYIHIRMHVYLQFISVCCTQVHEDIWLCTCDHLYVVCLPICVLVESRSQWQVPFPFPSTLFFKTCSLTGYRAQWLVSLVIPGICLLSSPHYLVTEMSFCIWLLHGLWRFKLRYWIASTLPVNHLPDPIHCYLNNWVTKDEDN